MYLCIQVEQTRWKSEEKKRNCSSIFAHLVSWELGVANIRELIQALIIQNRIPLLQQNKKEDHPINFIQDPNFIKLTYILCRAVAVLMCMFRDKTDTIHICYY